MSDEGQQEASGVTRGLSAEAFESLPCMALLVRDGMVTARNSLARRMTGLVGEETVACPISEVLGEGCFGVDLDPERNRVRFEGILLRRHGEGLRVSAAVHAAEFGGETYTLVLMMEHTREDAVDPEANGSFLEDMMEAMPRATVVAHGNRVLHVNAEFLQMFDYTSAEVLGRGLDELLVPDGLLHEEEMIAHQLERTGRLSFETQRRTRQGRLIHVQLMASRLRLGGEVNGMFITFIDIGKQKQEEERLRHRALHDGLTGLANRGLFLNRAELMLSRLRRRPDRSFAIFFLDLDGFKQVNDELGHAAGDAVLFEIANRLRECVRPQDTVARFGGDEFALLVDETGAEDEMERVALRLQEEVGRGIRLPGAEAHVSASIGIALAHIGYADADAMLRDADRMMYRAKHAGRGEFRVCRTPGMEAGELVGM
jgi:diguanylate cyclase (GGDEF)-like protein/PAS domain S-box-containing protein